MVEFAGRKLKGNMLPVREVEFKQPVVNIGSHADNDLILSGDGIQPFHAMLMLQDGKFRLAALSADAEMRVDGQAFSGESQVVVDGQRIELGREYAIAVQHTKSSSGMYIKLYQSASSLNTTEYVVPEGEEAILVNILSQQPETAVEQGAIYNLEVINAGPIVASFQVAVNGIPQEWVQIKPDEVNLNEGLRANVEVTITPPRSPDSVAGKHPIKIVVLSSNYPGHFAEVDTELIIQPYYEFVVGTLSPKQQNIFWKLRSGHAHLPISNQGNSAGNFDVTTLDDENGCSFEYEIKEGLTLNRQATITIPAGETVNLPIEVTPLKQPIAGFRNKRYHYTTTVQASGQGISPQMVSGSAVSIPLFGWWSIVVAILLVVLGLFFLFQPRIYSFQVAGGKDVIEQGDTTNLEWSVSPFASRISISGIDKQIESGQNHITIQPQQSTTYEMVAGNWLSGIMGMDQKSSQTVMVVPPTPNISAFEVDKTEISKGLPVTVRWSVTKADKVYLTIGDVVTELPQDQFSGEKSVVLDKDTVLTLEAQNLSGSELRSSFVKVIPPHITVDKFTVWVRPPSTTIPGTATNAYLPGVPHLASLLPVATPTPTPSSSSKDVIDSDFSLKFVELVPDETSDTGYRVEFYQPNRQLEKGEQVMVEWQVEGTNVISITPFTDALPAKGKQPFFPQESMNFVMSAKSGELEKLFMLPVDVYDGEPPVAPTIEFFKASPSKMVGEGDVTFAWSVSGAWTHIQIKNKDDIVADWINPQGFKEITVSETGSYVLTAWNGSLSTASIVEVTVDPALKDTTFTISDITPHSGYFRVGDSVNVFVNFAGLEAGVAEPTGTVTVSDSFSICKIALPTKSCVLTFTAPGVKEIKANYSGDDIYLQKTSDAYTKESIIVESNTVVLTPSYYYNDQGTAGASIPDLSAASLSVGQGLFIDVLVMPQNKAFVDDKKGQVMARYCPVNADGTIKETACISTGIATVEASAAPSAGHAEVVISNLPKAGDYALLISYEHLEDAYDPTIIGNTATDRITFTVGKGNLLLIGQGATPCTYKSCLFLEDSSATVIFDAQLMLDDMGDTDLSNDQVVDLYPTFPEPSALAVEPKDATGTAITPTWTSSCYWQVSGSIRQLVCKGVNLNQPMTLYNSFPSGDDNYQIYTAAYPLSVQIKKGTIINQTKSILEGLYTGNKIDLLKNNLHVVEKLSTSSEIANAVVYLSQDGGNLSDNLGIVSSTPASACVWSGNSLKLTLTDPVNDSCVVAFKHTISTAISLVFTYNGDSNYNGSSLTRSVTVGKQTGIHVEWTTSASWVIYEDNPVTLTFTCPSSESTCVDFAPEVLSAVNMTYTVPASCTLYQADTAVSNDTITLPTTGSTGTSMVVNDLKVVCTSSGAKAQTLAFSSPANSDFGIVASDASKTVTVAAKAVTMNGQVLMNNNKSSISSYLNVVNSSSQISNLYVAEEYWVVITLPNLPGGASPTDNDFIKLSTFSEIYDHVDTANSDCFNTATGTTGTFKLSLTKSNNDWVAKCHFRIKDSLSITSTTKTINAALVSPSFSALDYTVTVTSSTIEKRPVVITTTISVPAGTTTAGTGQYYARSDPSASIVVSDNHYMEDISGLSRSDFTIKLVDATTSTVDYTFGTSECTLSDKTLTCTIPDNTYYSSGKVEKLTVNYAGNDVFAASEDSSPQQLSIVAIPVNLNLDAIQWVDSSNVYRSFPEKLQCVNCSPAVDPQYFIKRKSYTLSIPVTVPDTVKFANVTPVVGTTDIPGEVLTLRLLHGSAGVTASATVSNGIASLTLNPLVTIYDLMALAGYGGNYYSTLYFDSIRLEYATANQVTKATTSPLSRSQRIYYRAEVTFNINIDSDNKGFDVTNLDPPETNCYDLYFEAADYTTCEGQPCWHTDDRSTDSNGDYNNGHDEKNSIDCTGSTVTDKIGYNNPYGCDTDGHCYKYSDAADDKVISLDDAVLSPSTSYQICLVSPTYFGCKVQGWPP